MLKSVVLVETREHKALPFVLDNLTSVLPDEWKIQIFHGNNNLDYINNIIVEKELVDRTTFTDLKIDSVSQIDSSELMLSEWLWESMIGDIILYFECDSILCPNSKYKISDFEDFEYIGGYWGTKEYNLAQPYPVVMNGGVSIRKKQYMLDIIRNEMKQYLERGGNPCEDYFVSDRVRNKPSVKDVLTFSIDNGYQIPHNMEAPFALHKPWGENPRKGHGRAYEQIKQVCPEVEELERLNK
jgi:hypothetical protein